MSTIFYIFAFLAFVSENYGTAFFLIILGLLFSDGNNPKRRP